MMECIFFFFRGGGWLEHAQINDIDFLYNSASCGLLYHNKITPLLTLQSLALGWWWPWWSGGGRAAA